MPFTKVQPPLLKEPACCRMCRAAADYQRKWFVDLEYIEDYWGAVYYCNLCFDELATAAGYTVDSKLDEYRESYLSTLEEYQDSHWKLNHVVDLLRDAGFDIRAFYDWIRSVASGETAVEFPERKSRLDEREEGSSESSDESRSTDVPILTLDI